MIHEIDVQASVAVDIGNGEAVPVVVVHELVSLAGVVGDAVDERDPALVHAVLEPKIVKHVEPGHGAELSLLSLAQPRRVEHLLGVRNRRERRARRQTSQFADQLRAAVGVQRIEHSANAPVAVHQRERCAGEDWLSAVRPRLDRQAEPVPAELQDLVGPSC